MFISCSLYYRRGWRDALLLQALCTPSDGMVSALGCLELFLSSAQDPEQERHNLRHMPWGTLSSHLYSDAGGCRPQGRPLLSYSSLCLSGKERKEYSFISSLSVIFFLS
jgi:hypothetical protein